MAILNFQKPDKVIMIDSSEFEGKFEFRPLEPGYGLTVGNALRRVLLSSLEGFAITSVKLENVEHEFSTIPGVVEDVTEIILNLKQVRFKRQIEDSEEEKVIIPAVKKLRLKNSKINGPFPADTIFTKPLLKKYDVIIGMYHDQVLSPMKALFNFDAINITLGLPFIRISPDHGPNYSMLGKNLSDPKSFIQALKFLDR